MNNSDFSVENFSYLSEEPVLFFSVHRDVPGIHQNYPQSF